MKKNIESPEGRLIKLYKENTLPYKELIAYYKCALMEVETKFNVLNEEFSLKYDRNPIETIKTRIKSPESIIEKAQRLNVPINAQSIEDKIEDIAGIRIICSYKNDIYNLAKSFLDQDDVYLVEEKDYIKFPKENGYRSLHLIVQTPIFLHDRKKMMKVEVQFRTISMDWWASLEHKIKYKKDIPYDIARHLEEELKVCADSSASLDDKMEAIQREADFYINDSE